MTTVSSVFAAADLAAAPGGSPKLAYESPAGTRTRAHDARARARLQITLRVGKQIRDDLANAWVWTDTPPALAELVSARVPNAELVPGTNTPMWMAWTVYSHVVAVPASAVLYALAWLLQHPARAGLATAVVLPLTIMWITR